MAKTYIQMFQEEFYPGIFLEIANATIEQYIKKEAHIIEQWKNFLNKYLEQIIQLQQNNQAEPVSEIIFSFLYTSLKENTALLRVDCYGEGGHVLDESMWTDYLPVDWLVIKLQEMEQKLSECATAEKLRRYIRPAEIEVLKLRAVRSLLYYFTMRFKYTIQKVVDFKLLAKVAKTDNFFVQMGEYMDWQRPLLAILPEVDIFNCDNNTNLRFRKFPAIYYSAKRFQDLILDQSQFLDCTFTDSTIENCSMNDCVFERCSFENVRFETVELKGVMFVKCTFNNTVFNNVVFSRNTTESDAEYFEPVEFYRSGLTNCEFHNCGLSQCIVTDCDTQDVTED